MRIVIFNINSFGGNYEYAKCLFETYKQHPDVASCNMLMPANAVVSDEGVLKSLTPDIIENKSKWIRKMQFLYRSFSNPYKLYKFLRKEPKSFVLLNDFDQLTAWFWTPLFKRLRKQHQFAVMLHDPDRDRFFPIKVLSEGSMKSIMSFIDVAFFHGFLPQKSYYLGDFIKVQVPHGIYESESVDESFLKALHEQAKGRKLLGILGNIRKEKNYEIIIDALQQLDDVALLVAGKAAHSGVSIDYYKRYAADRNVGDKLIWIDEYLDQPKFNAAIAACDIVLLYYQPSFTSQSGVLNTIAPFKKKLIVSDIQSSLTATVKQYDLAEVVPHDNMEQFVNTVQQLLNETANYKAQQWEHYMADNSWQKHVAIAVEYYKKCVHEH